MRMSLESSVFLFLVIIGIENLVKHIASDAEYEVAMDSGVFADIPAQFLILLTSSEIGIVGKKTSSSDLAS